MVATVHFARSMQRQCAVRVDVRDQVNICWLQMWMRSLMCLKPTNIDLVLTSTCVAFALRKQHKH